MNKEYLYHGSPVKVDKLATQRILNFIKDLK